MINIDINILSKLKGKYFHKSIQCITIVIALAMSTFTFLIIFHHEKLIKFIQAL